MNDLSSDQALLLQGVIMIVGLPLLVIVLGEVIERCKRHRHPLGPVFSAIRNLFLPPASLWLLTRHFFQVAADTLFLQIMASLSGLACIYTLLQIFNVILATEKKRRFLNLPNLLWQVIRALVVLGILSYLLAHVWQVDLTQVVGALGIGSLVIALALQDTLSNLVSGFLMLVSQPFKKGDWISFNGVYGRVIDQNWRSVTLEYQDWKITSVPNGVLSKATIDNFGPDGFWYSFTVEFSYDDPPNRVLAALNGLSRDFKATGLDQFLYDQNVYCSITEFGSSGITYKVWYCIPPDRGLATFRNYFFSRIYHIAQREGFTIPYPIGIDYKIEAPDGLPPKIPQKFIDHQPEISAHLRSLVYFRSLAEEDIMNLAAKTQIKQYAAGETIIQEGQGDEGYYVITNGKVRVWTQNHQGLPQSIDQLEPGDAFGEMAIFPGELSPVTVIAEEDARILLIDDDDIVQMVRDRPVFGSEMVRFVEQRRQSISLAKEPRRDRSASGHSITNGKLNAI
ncbi:MAG: mechanosensitive ion channel [Cyanothece sp. SIO2G6]|nr:mechanosensitive ion channel [Cyanothece sp. SIO2G6]